jgi:hypothetical protein
MFVLAHKRQPTTLLIPSAIGHFVQTKLITTIRLVHKPSHRRVQRLVCKFSIVEPPIRDNATLLKILSVRTAAQLLEVRVLLQTMLVSQVSPALMEPVRHRLPSLALLAILVLRARLATVKGNVCLKRLVLPIQIVRQLILQWFVFKDNVVCQSAHQTRAATLRPRAI